MRHSDVLALQRTLASLRHNLALEEFKTKVMAHLLMEKYGEDQAGLKAALNSFGISITRTKVHDA